MEVLSTVALIGFAKFIEDPMRIWLRLIFIKHKEILFREMFFQVSIYIFIEIPSPS